MATAVRRRNVETKTKLNETAVELRQRPNPRPMKKDSRFVMYHTLTSKGQLTIPQLVREDMGLETGEKVGFIKEGNDWVLVRPIDVVTRTAGVFKSYADALDRVYTAEELRDAYEVGVANEVMQSMQDDE